MPSYRAHCDGRLVQINHAANGLGDALLGLVAVKAFRASHPESFIRYRIKPQTMPFIRLFDGGFDELAEHDPNEATKEHLELNPGYAHECETRAQLPRWLRYCRNLGVDRPLLPEIRNRQQLIDAGKHFRDSIFLAPFSTHRDREWPLKHWLSLEEELSALGYRVIVLHDDQSRCQRFRSEKFISSDASKVVSALLNCSLLIGNDSGLAHLAGILQKPTLVLCGPTTGEPIFGIYPDVTFLEGHLSCKGCWWQQPRTEECNSLCLSLASITPEEVAASAERITQRRLIYSLYPSRSLLSPDKLNVLNRYARSVRRLSAPMAELGVYRGGSAKVISSASPEKTLHLFDTFNGLPEDDIAPSGHHRRGDFVADEAEARSYLEGQNAVFHVGAFPQTAQENEHYSFVHLDGDTYQTTIAGLEHFWPRLVDGGVLVLDDWLWPHTPGVEKAIHDEGLSHLVGSEAAFQGILRKPERPFN